MISVALLLAAPCGDAAARKFQMSGTWVMRRGQVFWPLQFVGSTRGSMNTAIHGSMGNLSMAFGFPNGPVPGKGGVTASGSAPATLRLPRHRFGGMFSAKIPLAGVTFDQFTTRATADAPAAPATLARGGGPGSFTWCPGDPACVRAGGMRSTDPPQGAGARNGRVIYRAGANRFGGAMQMLLAGGSVASFFYKQPPRQEGQVPGGPSGTQHTGGPYANVQTTGHPPTFVTQPTMSIPAGSLILHPGPKVTTMGGLTATRTGPTLFLGPGARTTNTGFPFTTGSVFAQQTRGTGGTRTSSR